MPPPRSPDGAGRRRTPAPGRASSKRPTERPTERLTDREAAVVGLLLAGYTNREIADALGVSVATAKRHLSNVMVKWRCRNRTEVAMRALATPAAIAPRRRRRRRPGDPDDTARPDAGA